MLDQPSWMQQEDPEEVVALDEWVRWIKMFQNAILEPSNQQRVNDLLNELKELEGIYGQVFRLRLEGGYAIKLQVELSLVQTVSK